MTTTSVHERLLTDVHREFSLGGARAVLFAGSRMEQLDYPGSDVDFLAVFDDPADVPMRVPHPPAVGMANTMGISWVGWIGEQEVNVTAVSRPAVLRAGALVAEPLSATRVPMLQPVEIVALHRLATGTAVSGAGYLAALVGGLTLARLPPALFAAYHCSAAGHARGARRLIEGNDPFGFEVMVMASAAALGLATLCAYGRVGATIKKIAAGLTTLEAGHADLPMRRADLLLMRAGLDPWLRLDILDAALRRSRDMARQWATQDGLWAEAAAAIEAPV